MSGVSDMNGKCPNCNATCHSYSENKPVPHGDITCTECGFYTTVHVIGNYMELEELNERRECDGLHPLQELPDQNFLL